MKKGQEGGCGCRFVVHGMSKKKIYIRDGVDWDEQRRFFGCGFASRADKWTMGEGRGRFCKAVSVCQKKGDYRMDGAMKMDTSLGLRSRLVGGLR